jgi:hypothetical protein
MDAQRMTRGEEQPRARSMPSAPEDRVAVEGPDGTDQ